MPITQNKKKFGADAVFLTSFLIFLGPVFFLRLGYSVGTLGFMGTMLVIIVGATLAMTFSSVIAEIISNQRSGGRDEYSMISRSFGLNITAPIGIALYLLQVLSVSFMVVAFTESFSPLLSFLGTKGISFHLQYIGIPCILILIRIMIKGKSHVNNYILYSVLIVLIISIIVLFLGHTEYSKENNISLLSMQTGNLKDSFFSVFSIFFSAFIGITVSTGLIDRINEPEKAFPASLKKAVFLAVIIYGFVALKLAVSATPDDLVNNPLIFSNIGLMGRFIIPVALAIVTLPLAIQSLTLAPKTLQSLAIDNLLPFNRLNNSMSKGKGKSIKPYNAALFTSLLSFFFVLQGDLNFIAKIITVLLLVSCGGICLMSLMHHFSADPSYQPSIRTRWYIPLIGIIFSLVLLFGMKFYYALTTLSIVVIIYLRSNQMNKDPNNIKSVYNSIIFQFSRSLQVLLQKRYFIKTYNKWRPSIIGISENPIEKDKSSRLIEWISNRYGFGTYIYFVEGSYSKVAKDEAQKELKKWIVKSGKKSKVYFDTIISPAYSTALNQVVQYPGVSGIPNNLILFEIDREKKENGQRIIENLPLLQAAKLDICILGSVNRSIKFRNGIDVWIKDTLIEYSKLTIILASIIHDHPSWKNGKILFYMLISKDHMDESAQRLKEILRKDKLPIRPENLEVIALDANVNPKDIICEKSVNTGLSIICYDEEELKQDRNFLNDYEGLSDILFVNASELREFS